MKPESTPWPALLQAAMGVAKGKGRSATLLGEFRNEPIVEISRGFPQIVQPTDLV